MSNCRYGESESRGQIPSAHIT